MHGETFEIEIERVMFQANDSPYAVLVGRTPGGDTRTLCGELESVSEGDSLTVEATRSEHSRYGLRWQVQSARLKEPDDRPSRVAFLCSIDGIGKARAEQLVDAFGDTVLEDIDRDPEASFRALEGVGEKTAERAARSWRDRRHIRAVMALLDDAGIAPSQGIASRAIDAWESEAVTRLSRDPYLLMDLTSVGFTEADRLALHLGVATDATERIQAGALHLLREAKGSDGHLFLPLNDLRSRVSKLLRVSPDELVLEVSLANARGIVVDEDRCYTKGAYRSETNFSADVWLLANAPLQARTVRPEDLDPMFTEDQRHAIAACFQQQLTLISGPPGVGKTTVIREVVAIAKKLHLEVALIAPTGRAATRMAKVSGHPASTIHRLLGFRGDGYPPEHDAENPLTADLIVSDEASMLDVELGARLLDAMSDTAKLVLVGDPDQLPPPGPGDALAQLLASPALPHHRLTQVFRQAERSTLLQAAAKIRLGQHPHFEVREGDTDDLGVIWSADPRVLREQAVRAARETLPDRLGLTADEVQVIAPIYRGEAGVDALNAAIRERANPHGEEIMGGRLRIGDRLIMTKNDYSLVADDGEPLVNGAFCTVTGFIPGRDACLKVVCEHGAKLKIPTAQAAALKLGYAITAHKSQGSEWPATVVVLPPAQTNVFLTRRLLRTALTRARRYCLVVADEPTFRAAVGRADHNTRNCAVIERITGMFDRAVERELASGPVPLG